MSMTQALRGLGLALLTAACSTMESGTAGRAWRTTTDSIGDTIVVRTTGGSSEDGAHTLVEELRIGKLDGPPEYTFGTVSALVAGRDGGVYVADEESHAIRQYDSTGVHVRSFGGLGAGPGEFDRLNGMAGLPDGRLALWDPTNGRINVYSPTGESIDTWAFPTGSFRSFGRNMVFSDSAGHTYLKFDVPAPAGAPSATGMPPKRDALFRYDRTGVLDDTLPAPVWADQPPQMTITIIREGRVVGASTYYVRWRPTMTWTFSPLGYFVAGRTDRYAIDELRPDGKIVRIARDMAQVRLDPEERATEEESLTRNIRRNSPDWKWTGPPMPEVKPFFDQIICGLDGRIWVSVSQPSERVANVVTTPSRPDAPPPPKWRWRSPVVYDVFEPDGRYLGNVRMPPRTSLYAMRGSQVWGVVRDSLDVEYVTRFRIEPPF
jgi:hypothetical protein